MRRLPKGVAFLMAANAAAQTTAPVEFGAIAWQRDYEVARATAKEQRKPLLMLFQEVPG